jgi:hypothetical protein
MGRTVKELESIVNGFDLRLQELEQHVGNILAKQDEMMQLIKQAQAGMAVVPGQGDPSVTYVIHSVPTEGIQPQARKCLRLAADHFGLEAVITEPDLRAFIRSKQAEISNRQDAWARVFCYYRGRLKEMGHLTHNE